MTTLPPLASYNIVVSGQVVFVWANSKDVGDALMRCQSHSLTLLILTVELTLPHHPWAIPRPSPAPPFGSFPVPFGSFPHTVGSFNLSSTPRPSLVVSYMAEGAQQHYPLVDHKVTSGPG